MPWTGDRLVLAVYKVRGLNKIKAADEDVALDLGFPLPTNDVGSPRMCKLLGQEGEQPGPEPQEEVEVELEPVEDFMYTRMSEEEWRTTIERYGADHYVAEMATRWRRIEPEEGNLKSVIPAAIAADIDRDWVNAPRIFLMSEEGEELHVGRMLGTRTTRIQDYDPERLNSSFLKACKIYNMVTNEEEMIVFWIRRRVVVHQVPPADQRHAWRGQEEQGPPDRDHRGRVPRLAVMSVDGSGGLLQFVEVDEEELGNDEARMMKATPETLYTPNIEELLASVSAENPLKVTHTVDPREVLPVVERWIPAMKAELDALEKMAAIKRCTGKEAEGLRKDPNVIVVPSKLVFTIKPGLEPGQVRRKVRGVACGNFSGETAEELGDVYSAGATIDLVRLCLAEVNANPGWIAATDDVKTAFLRAPIPELPNGGMLWRSGWMRIVPCVTDENLHKLIEVDDTGQERIVGYILFYVDDTLAVGPPDYVHSFYDWLEATWETVVRFLGLELSLQEDGRMRIAQRGYIDELLRKREVTGFSKVPFLKEWATDEVPADPDCSPALIKEAQQRCGEIPLDDPEIAKKILAYYNSTKDAAFIIEKEQSSKLVMFSDASHSPAGAKSISGTLVMWKGLPICWRAANQGLTALSSAEAELIALSEGAQLLRSVKTTLEDMGIRPETSELRVDATAAIAVASSGGSWRTRHLRLRENWLVELVNSNEYVLMHQPGVEQLADGLTKQLASDRAWKLLQAWSSYKGSTQPEVKKVMIAKVDGEWESAAASAAAQATIPCTTAISNQHEGTLSRCTKVLVGLGLVAGACGSDTGNHEVYTGVDSEHELWVAVLLVMVTTIFFWEWSKRAAGGVKKAVKLKMFSSTSTPRLSKAEGKELLMLLGLDERSIEQEARLNALI
ncbi:GIP, partial [Symbiodinium sp. CCMP2456]